MTEAELKEVVPRDFPAASRPTKEEIQEFEKFVGLELERRIVERAQGKLDIDCKCGVLATLKQSASGWACASANVRCRL